MSEEAEFTEDREEIVVAKRSRDEVHEEAEASAEGSADAVSNEENQKKSKLEDSLGLGNPLDGPNESESFPQLERQYSGYADLPSQTGSVVGSDYSSYSSYSTPAASSPAPAPAAPISTLSPTGDSEVIEVTPDKVGQIIGSKGAIIQDMQARTGAKIFVNQNFPPGVNRQVNINGTPAQVKAAGDLVRKIISEGPTAIHVNSLVGGPSIALSMDCPQPLVGRVIGSSGATIKELQSRSGAKIQIDQDFPEGVPRKINISGTQTAVNLAVKLVTEVMENGPSSAIAAPMSMGMGMGMGGMAPMGGMFPYGAGAAGVMGGGGGTQSQSIDCPKAIVGRIIGRGGETINMLQAKSGAKMQVEQNVPVGAPCKVNISGGPQNVAHAVQLVYEVMNRTPGSTAPLGGGAPFMSQYGGFQAPFQGGGAGGMPGNPMLAQQQAFAQQQMMQQFQMQQQQQYAQAYGGAAPQSYPPQAGTYGMPAAGSAYGMAAPAPVPVQKQSTWTEHKTDDGNSYYYNTVTGASQVFI